MEADVGEGPCTSMKAASCAGNGLVRIGQKVAFQHGAL